MLEVSAAEPARSSARIQATCCATLVDQWVADGVTHAMVSPGSRSTPMALALAAHPAIRLEVFHDERTAGFAALGAGLATGRPALVLCTSGTAAAHFYGAVLEAHLSGVPMIVLTADRPPELRDVGAPQTIDQTKLFGDAVRWFHDPGVPSDEASHTWRSLARRVVSSSSGVRPGPVHVNLPFREPLVAEPYELPPLLPGLVGVHRNSTQLEPVVQVLVGQARGVIVAGRGIDEPQAVAALSEATGWPVLADARSGCRGLPCAVAASDAILRHDELAASLRPDVVVHLGEPPASKVLNQWLAAAGGVQVRVTEVDTVIDPAHTITHRVLSPVGVFCHSIVALLGAPGDASWAHRWGAVSAAADAALADVFAGAAADGEPAVARAVSSFTGHVLVASSMPVRDLEWFGSPDQVATVWANRGANGIDGTVATAIGIAAATDEAVVVLLGDVALLHDASSLTALSGRAVDVRIVVVDNDGGGIFSFLPQAASLPGERFEQLFGTPHHTDLVGLAAAHGLPARTVANTTELRAALYEPGSSLVRVASNRAANVRQHELLHAAVIDAVAPFA